MPLSLCRPSHPKLVGAKVVLDQPLASFVAEWWNWLGFTAVDDEEVAC